MTAIPTGSASQGFEILLHGVFEYAAELVRVVLPLARRRTPSCDLS